jgi:hypothetical protein
VSPKERALNARLLLENVCFTEAFESLERDLMDSWKASHPDKWKEREQMHAQLKALQDVKQKLETFIATAALDSTAR